MLVRYYQPRVGTKSSMNFTLNRLTQLVYCNGAIAKLQYICTAANSLVDA